MDHAGLEWRTGLGIKAAARAGADGGILAAGSRSVVGGKRSGCGVFFPVRPLLEQIRAVLDRPAVGAADFAVDGESVRAANEAWRGFRWRHGSQIVPHLWP